MRDRDVLAIHFVAVIIFRFFRCYMCDKLVTEEIKINPFIISSAFGATENGAVKMAGGFEIVNGGG